MNNNPIFETMFSRNYIPLGMYRSVEYFITHYGYDGKIIKI
jgi:hypothetical protein